MVSLRLCEMGVFFSYRQRQYLRLPVIAVNGRYMGCGILIFVRKIDNKELSQHTTAISSSGSVCIFLSIVETDLEIPSQKQRGRSNSSEESNPGCSANPLGIGLDERASDRDPALMSKATIGTTS